MTTQELEFSRVNLAAYNPRVELQPADQEWKDIEASLDEFGQVVGLVWNQRTGNLVGGHQRIRIMRHRGRDTAHFTVVDLDLEAEKRLNLVLNRVTGRWDNQKLNAMLGDLRTAGLSLERLGFTQLELQKVLGARPKKTATDPDGQSPGRPAIPRSKTGDVYEFQGESGLTHRLLCGDARERHDLAVLMGPHQARLIFTDPPYNVGYDNSTRGDGRRPLGTISNDATTPANFQALLTAAFGNATAVALPNACLYTFLASATHIDFELSLRAAGWRVKQQLIWAKHFALSRADYHYAHEPLMYAARPELNCQWFGARSETTLWDTSPGDLRKMSKDRLLELLLEVRETASVWHEARDPGGDYEHPTQKPTGLVRKALVNSSLPREGVLDMFAGSGSTMIGAELEDRQAFLLELDPGNCDVIAKRWGAVFPETTVTLNGEPLT